MYKHSINTLIFHFSAKIEKIKILPHCALSPPTSRRKSTRFIFLTTKKSILVPLKLKLCAWILLSLKLENIRKSKVNSYIYNV